jgi:hypothetical protein
MCVVSASPYNLALSLVSQVMAERAAPAPTADTLLPLALVPVQSPRESAAQAQASVSRSAVVAAAPAFAAAFPLVLAPSSLFGAPTSATSCSTRHAPDLPTCSGSSTGHHWSDVAVLVGPPTPRQASVNGATGFCSAGVTVSRVVRRMSHAVGRQCVAPIMHPYASGAPLLSACPPRFALCLVCLLRLWTLLRAVPWWYVLRAIVRTDSARPLRFLLRRRLLLL